MVRLLWWRFHLHGKVNPRSNNQCHSYSCAIKTISSRRLGMGRENHMYLLSFACQQTFQLPFAVCLVGIRAHGWDPLVPTATGVYDGLQGAPMYFIIGGEYQGLNLLAWIGWACIVRRSTVNGLDQWLGPTPRKCGRECTPGCAARLLFWKDTPLQSVKRCDMLPSGAVLMM
jgi:hypothetical protein